MISPTTEASGASLPRMATSSSRGLAPGPPTPCSIDDLAVEAGGEVHGGAASPDALAHLRDADRGAEIGGLDEDRVGERLLDGASAALRVGAPLGAQAGSRRASAAGRRRRKAASLRLYPCRPRSRARRSRRRPGRRAPAGPGWCRPRRRSRAARERSRRVSAAGKRIAQPVRPLKRSWPEAPGFPAWVPSSKAWASASPSQRPCLLMPMGTTSYFLRVDRLED